MASWVAANSFSIFFSYFGKGRRQNSQPLAAARVLQYSTAMYSFLYINWLQLAAEYGGCSLQILTSPP